MKTAQAREKFLLFCERTYKDCTAFKAQKRQSVTEFSTKTALAHDKRQKMRKMRRLA